jgi:hypothetical protein
MPTTVQMLQTRQGDAGAVLTAGQQYSLRTELADALVAAGAARYAWTADPDSFTSEVFWSDSTGTALVPPDGFSRSVQIIPPILKAGAQLAQQANPLLLRPWLADVAWTINTTYQAGQVRSNGGNAYVCVAAGLSAGAGGPSGTGAANITDNTATWEYLRPAVTGTVTGAPTITRNNTDYSGSYPRKYGNTGNTASTVADDASFNILGGAPYQRYGTDNYSFWTSATTDFVTGRVGKLGNGIEFKTDAQAVVIEGWQGVTENMSRLTVDGRQVTTGFEPGETSTRSSILIQFNEYLPEHTVRIEGLNQNFVFKQVMVPANYQVWAPGKYGPNIYALGNSFFSGGGGYPVLQSPTTVVRAFTGAYKLTDGSIGGTGFDTAGTARTWINRLDEMTLFAPDMVVIQASFFAGGTDRPAAAALTRAYFNAMREIPSLKNVPVFAVGLFASTTGPSATIIAQENGFFDGIAALNDPYIFQIRNATNTPLSFLTGTGTPAAPSGDGNSNRYIGPDAAHTNHAGTYYYGLRIADAIRGIITSRT